MTALTFTFPERGDFAASHAAEAFLKSRGFSFGPLQADDPRGVLFNELERPRIVAKWRCLSEYHRSQLHGLITGDPRKGPVLIKIFAHAPAAARQAVSRAA